MIHIVRLNDRALIKIAGVDAFELLNRLVTCDLEDLHTGDLTFGALLTPQGKILFDFFIAREENGFLFDIAASSSGDFIKRMMFYRLRAAVTIEPVADNRFVYALWGGETMEAAAFADPRHGEMGYRAYLPELVENTSEDDYDAHRIAIGVPQSGADFEFGGAFPHDVMMDQFADKHVGVDFAKGCFVGQEVVSRMQHRGTARRRLIKVSGKSALSNTGDIIAGEKPIGSIASVSGTIGLANIRMDRASRALAEDLPITLNGQPVVLTIPEWTGLNWPQS